MLTRPQFPDLLEPGFRDIFDGAYAEIPEVFPQLFHVETSNKQDEKMSGSTGFGLLQQTDEGGAVDYEDPIQTYDKTFTHLKYTKGFKVSEELWEDDQYNIIKRKPAMLGRAARRTAEYYAASVFNNAFSTSYLGGDAKPLFSVSHPRADGGTAQSNASATGITLTEENLETGRLAAKEQLDDKGQKIQTLPDTILVPNDLEKTANIIMSSALRSGTADNDFNFYRGKFKVVPWEWITSTTAWFLIDSNMHELYWFWRVKPEFKQDVAFDTGMGLYKCRARFSYGWSNWRGVWGSKGDGLAYAS